MLFVFFGGGRFQLSIAFRMFDRDDSGAVDSHELDSFMEVLRGETNVGKAEGGEHKDGYAGKDRGRGGGERTRLFMLRGVLRGVEL